MTFQLISHRGLDIFTGSPYSEQNFDSFKRHLLNGRGIEFDVRFTIDNEIVVSHEATIESAFGSLDIARSTLAEIKKANSQVFTFSDLLPFISDSNLISALHYKGPLQNFRNTENLAIHIESGLKELSNLIVFDIKPQEAKFLKNIVPNICCGVSLAHPFDILRFNAFVSGTLFGESIFAEFPKLYSWAWIDEWDMAWDAGSDAKPFVTNELLKRLRSLEIKSAIVSPELHATSPHLLGAECHPDGIDISHVINRFLKLDKNLFDVWCTDYSTEIERKPRR